MLTGELRNSVQVDSSPVPALRYNAGQACAELRVSLTVRQQHAEFGCNTGSGFVLKTTFSQYALEECAGGSEARRPGRGERVLKLAFQNSFPIFRVSVVEAGCGCDERLARCSFEEAGRLQLDFKLVLIGNGRIGAVERSVRRCRSKADHQADTDKAGTSACAKQRRD